jgi:hypothetical protein
VATLKKSLIDRAKTFDAPGAAVHGYRTMLDLMTDLNPLTGHLYVEALHMTRVAREGYVLLCGKYPHPQTMVPGGMSTTLTPTVMHEVFLRLSQFFDYSKKIAAIWDDITTFFYAANPEYRKVGARRAHLIDTGIFDDPAAYDANYANAGAWGDRRWATPGAIVDGKLVTTIAPDQHGSEEFVDVLLRRMVGNGQTPRFPIGRSAVPLAVPVEQVTKPRRRARAKGQYLGHGTAMGSAGDGGRCLRTAVEHGGGTEAAREPVPRIDRPFAAPPDPEGHAARDGDGMARAGGVERVRTQPRTGLLCRVHRDGGVRQLAPGDGVDEGRRPAHRDAVRDPPQRRANRRRVLGRVAAITHHLYAERVTNYQILTPST